MGRRPNVRYNNGGVDLPERGPGRYIVRLRNIELMSEKNMKKKLSQRVIKFWPWHIPYYKKRSQLNKDLFVELIFFSFS